MSLFFLLRKGQTQANVTYFPPVAPKPAIVRPVRLTATGADNYISPGFECASQVLTYAERCIPTMIQNRRLETIQSPRPISLLGLAIPYASQIIISNRLAKQTERDAILKSAVLNRPDILIQHAHQRADYEVKRVTRIETPRVIYRRLRRTMGKRALLKAIHRMPQRSMYFRTKGYSMKRRALMPSTRFTSKAPVYGRLIRRYQQRYMSKYRFRKSRRRRVAKFTWKRALRGCTLTRKPRRKRLRGGNRGFLFYHVSRRTHSLTQNVRPLYWRDRNKLQKRLVKILLRFKPGNKVRNFAHGLWFAGRVPSAELDKMPKHFSHMLNAAHNWTIFMYNRTVPKESIQSAVKLTSFVANIVATLTIHRQHHRRMCHIRTIEVRRRRAARREFLDKNPKILKRYKKFYSYKGTPFRLTLSHSNKLRRIRARSGMEFLRHFGLVSLGSLVIPNVHQRPKFNPKRMNKPKQRKLSPKKWMKILTRLAGRRERTGKDTRIARVAMKAVTASIMYMHHWVRNRDRRYRNRMRRLYKRYHLARQVAELYAAFNTNRSPEPAERAQIEYNDFIKEYKEGQWNNAVFPVRFKRKPILAKKKLQPRKKKR